MSITRALLYLSPKRPVIFLTNRPFRLAELVGIFIVSAVNARQGGFGERATEKLRQYQIYRQMLTDHSTSQQRNAARTAYGLRNKPVLPDL